MVVHFHLFHAFVSLRIEKGSRSRWDLYMVWLRVWVFFGGGRMQKKRKIEWKIKCMCMYLCVVYVHNWCTQNCYIVIVIEKALLNYTYTIYVHYIYMYNYTTIQLYNCTCKCCCCCVFSKYYALLSSTYLTLKMLTRSVLYIIFDILFVVLSCYLKFYTYIKFNYHLKK